MTTYADAVASGIPIVKVECLVDGEPRWECISLGQRNDIDDDTFLFAMADVSALNRAPLKSLRLRLFVNGDSVIDDWEPDRFREAYRLAIETEHIWSNPAATALLD